MHDQGNDVSVNRRFFVHCISIKSFFVISLFSQDFNLTELPFHIIHYDLNINDFK